MQKKKHKHWNFFSEDLFLDIFSLWRDKHPLLQCRIERRWFQDDRIKPTMRSPLYAAATFTFWSDFWKTHGLDFPALTLGLALVEIMISVVTIHDAILGVKTQNTRFLALIRP